MSEKTQVLIDTLLRADKDLNEMKKKHKNDMQPLKEAYTDALKAVQAHVPDGTQYEHEQEGDNDTRGPSAVIVVDTVDEKKAYTKKDYEKNIKKFYMQAECFGNIEEQDADDLAQSMLNFFKENPRIVTSKKVTLKRKKPGRIPDATKQSKA